MKKMEGKAVVSKTSLRSPEEAFSGDLIEIESPLTSGVEKLPINSMPRFVTVNITLPNGRQISNTEQFQDDEEEELEAEEAS
jgi:hypothetical protein